MRKLVAAAILASACLSTAPAAFADHWHHGHRYHHRSWVTTWHWDRWHHHRVKGGYWRYW